MSQTVQRQTNQTPAWLMFSGGVIGTVGAIVMRHAENADQLILALGSPAEVSHVAAVAHSEMGAGPADHRRCCGANWNSCDCGSAADVSCPGVAPRRAL